MLVHLHICRLVPYSETKTIGAALPRQARCSAFSPSESIVWLKSLFRYYESY